MRRAFAIVGWLVLGVMGGGLQATTVRPPTFEHLVQTADLVVRGEVTAVRSEWRGTGDERRIYTLVTVRVDEAIVGAAPATLELQLLGGEVGTRRMEVVGQPKFAVGDRDFLFVQKNGRQLCPLVAMGHGRYLVADDPAGSGGTIVARNNGVPLASVDEVALPLTEGAMAGRMAAMKRDTGLAPSEFAAQVRAQATALGRTDVVRVRTETVSGEVAR